MLYYTQVIFVLEGQEATFEEFEAHVLPLLQRHGGQLLYRVRPGRPDVIETAMDYPYEIHLVTFPARANFEAYRDDPERMRHMPLKEKSIRKAMLIEGKLL